MKIGLTLSGGGARGISHLGVIQALEEFGVSPSVMSGASAGSIIGSLYSYGYSPKEILSYIQNISLYRSVRPAWSLSGLLSLDGLKDLLLNKMPENSFSSLNKPLTVVATDLKKGSSEYFTEGELVAPIMASCCIPGIFSPVPINGSMFVDGGVLDNLPAKAIRDKCDLLIGVNCNFIGSDFDAKNLKTVIERSMLMSIGMNIKPSKTLCDVYIEAPGVSNISGFEIGKAQELFNVGYEFTKKNFSADDFKVKA